MLGQHDCNPPVLHERLDQSCPRPVGATLLGAKHESGTSTTCKVLTLVPLLFSHANCFFIPFIIFWPGGWAHYICNCPVDIGSSEDGLWSTG
ncbi:hypothetical protein VTP01DRAFT_3445 [Rhizomucor pusillus]|uniref:uncharacterized protein n=1 Tax=Rhizomucor pusillus TaxID=4840 RepID=UPI003743E119